MEWYIEDDDEDDDADVLVGASVVELRVSGEDEVDEHVEATLAEDDDAE